MSAIGQVAVQDIWLVRETSWDGLDYAVVYVQMYGVWHEAIRELIDSQFSHNITANGLVSDSCTPVVWGKAKERT